LRDLIKFAFDEHILLMADEVGLGLGLGLGLGEVGWGGVGVELRLL